MRKCLGIIMGGYSSEYKVSMNSGNNMFNAVDRNKFEVFGIEINPNGNVAWDEQNNKIEFNETEMTVTRNRQTLKLDLLFNLVHGHPGEDGTLALKWETAGIPYSSSAPGPSALTFHKAWSNGVVSRMGAKIPKAILIDSQIDVTSLKSKLSDFNLPIFVKPSRAGSSFGITKIHSLNDLKESIKIASKEDDSIVIEEGIAGIELACGLLKVKNKIKVLGITEIISKNEFFDYEAKYSGLTEEITPADISSNNSLEIENISKSLYTQLNLKGFCRFDFILPKNSPAVLIEINTVPGMTPESIIPNQLKNIDLSLKEFTNLLAEEVLENGKNRNFPGIF